MKKLNYLRRSAISAFAFMVLVVAQQASAQFSIIYYQSEVPEKLKR